jgi:2-keto-4-pentenoate hydratase
VPQTKAQGCLIQDAVHERLAADFGALVGYKIGCTSTVMQPYLDIPHPCRGGVFASGAWLNTGDEGTMELEGLGRVQVAFA